MINQQQNKFKKKHEKKKKNPNDFKFVYNSLNLHYTPDIHVLDDVKINRKSHHLLI